MQRGMAAPLPALSYVVMKMTRTPIYLSLIASVLACRAAAPAAQKGPKMSTTAHANRITKTDAEWKAELTPEQYRILRHKGTERPFANEFNDNKAKGTYVCAADGQHLFSSEAKFDSGTGWPSFWQPVAPAAVDTSVDRSHGTVRSEVHCARCGGHLGHLFEDGPAPSGLRYCINSAALKKQK